MKKCFCLILCLILSVFCLAGCDEADKNGFFSQKKLDSCLISNLPKIKSDKSTLKYGRYTFNTNKEEFVEYIESVFDYLVDCSFDYFGYPTEVLSTFFGGAPKCAFQRGDKLSDFKTDLAYSDQDVAEGLHYFFVWGNDGLDKETSQIINAKYMQIGFLGNEDIVTAYIVLPYSLMDYTFYLKNSEQS